MLIALRLKLALCHNKDRRGEYRLKYFIYFIVIVAFLDTFSQLPIMSTFAQSLGGTPLVIGLVIGMYSFANMIGNIIAGAAVDKFGAKKSFI